MKTDALTVDYGPKFLGSAVRTDRGIVCLVPIHIRDSRESQAAMRELVKDLGGECGRCRNCPAGRES